MRHNNDYWELSVENAVEAADQEHETIASEGIENAGKAVREKEHVVFARLLDFSQLKGAKKATIQEQYGVSIDKSDKNAGAGKIRVRKVTRRNGHTHYEMTTKSKVTEGSIEVTVPTTEENFIQMKVLSDGGMFKHRYEFPIKGTGLKWEIDAVPDGNGGYFPWVRAEIEVKDLKAPLPEFPIKTEEIIFPPQFSEMSEEEWKQKTDELYQRFFIKENPYLNRKQVQETQLKGDADEEDGDDVGADEAQDGEGDQVAEAKKEKDAQAVMSVDNITDDKHKADLVEKRAEQIKEAKGIDDEEEAEDAEGEFGEEGEEGTEEGGEEGESEEGTEEGESEESEEGGEEGGEKEPTWEGDGDDEKKVSKESYQVNVDGLELSTEGIIDSIKKFGSNISFALFGHPAYNGIALVKGKTLLAAMPGYGGQDEDNPKMRPANSPICVLNDSLVKSFSKKGVLEAHVKKLLEQINKPRDSKVPFSDISSLGYGFNDYIYKEKEELEFAVGSKEEWDVLLKELKAAYDKMMKFVFGPVMGEWCTANTFSGFNWEEIFKVDKIIYALNFYTNLGKSLGRIGKREVSKESFAAGGFDGVELSTEENDNETNSEDKEDGDSEDIGFSEKELTGMLGDAEEDEEESSNENFNPLSPEDIDDYDANDIEVGHDNTDTSFLTTDAPRVSPKDALFSEHVNMEVQNGASALLFNNHDGMLSIYLPAKSWAACECFETGKGNWLNNFLNERETQFAQAIEFLKDDLESWKRWVLAFYAVVRKMAVNWDDVEEAEAYRMGLAKAIHEIPIREEFHNYFSALSVLSGKTMGVNEREFEFTLTVPSEEDSQRLNELESNVQSAMDVVLNFVPAPSRVYAHPQFKRMVGHLSAHTKMSEKDAAIFLHEYVFNKHAPIHRFLTLVEHGLMNTIYTLAVISKTNTMVTPNYKSNIYSAYLSIPRLENKTN